MYQLLNIQCTRALHAEENAFLQISKYGGTGVRDGFLFCTASPCELCSKKAYQLGIRNIYYIDPYPGISEKHILNSGRAENRPQMNVFYGAIGEAYIALFRPIMPYKDELELLSGINCKEVAEKGVIDNQLIPETQDLKYDLMDFTINFKSRTSIEGIRKVKFEILNGSYKKIERRLMWTGSSYDCTELLKGDYLIEDYQDKIAPYRYCIDFKEEKGKGSKIEYTVKSTVSDETYLMHPYFSHYVKYPMEMLILKIVLPSDDKIMDNVRVVRYADAEMKIPYEDKELKLETNNAENIITEYTLKVELYIPMQ